MVCSDKHNILFHKKFTIGSCRKAGDKTFVGQKRWKIIELGKYVRKNIKKGSVKKSFWYQKELSQDFVSGMMKPHHNRN